MFANRLVRLGWGLVSISLAWKVASQASLQTRDVFCGFNTFYKSPFLETLLSKLGFLLMAASNSTKPVSELVMAPIAAYTTAAPIVFLILFLFNAPLSSCTLFVSHFFALMLLPALATNFPRFRFELSSRDFFLPAAITVAGAWLSAPVHVLDWACEWKVLNFPDRFRYIFDKKFLFYLFVAMALSCDLRYADR
eukprot:c13774_g1_i2.p1 GENE.c13774_g1_i2~~c13774_g1_i2.p1  ORF type:complete len:194 (+),score=13.81 c13774_g1_i2:128-709(+)